MPYLHNFGAIVSKVRIENSSPLPLYACHVQGNRRVRTQPSFAIPRFSSKHMDRNQEVSDGFSPSMRCLYVMSLMGTALKRKFVSNSVLNFAGKDLVGL